MIYVLGFIALFLFFFGKEAGKLSGLAALGGLCSLVGSLFVGGGLVFLAIAGRFL